MYYRQQKQPVEILSDAEYQKLIEKVRIGVERRLKIKYEEDPEEALKRLSVELELRNDLGMRSIQATLNKFKLEDDELSDDEQHSLMKFLSGIPSLKDKMSTTLYGTENFK